VVEGTEGVPRRCKAGGGVARSSERGVVHEAGGGGAEQAVGAAAELREGERWWEGRRPVARNGAAIAEQPSPGGNGVNARDAGDAEHRALGKDAKRSSLDTKLG